MSSPQKLTAVEDDLALRVWDGDETVLPDLLLYCAGSIEAAIARRPGMKSIAEDIVAEAIARFWKYRQQYDGRRSLRCYLYRIAVNVAKEYAAGRLKWQRARNLEAPVDGELVGETDGVSDADSDETVKKPEPLHQALSEVVGKLSALFRDIIQAYANAGNCPPDAAELGIEMGRRHNHGVPYPAGTIRQYKKRARDTIVLEMKKLGFDLTSARTLQ